MASHHLVYPVVVFPLIERVFTSYGRDSRKSIVIVAALLLAVAVGSVLLEADQWQSNYFRALGLGRDASSADVKRAYRKLSLEAHPDRFVRPVEKEAAERRFILLQTAHEALADDVRRDAYDRWGARGLGWIQRGEPVAFQGLVSMLVSSLVLVVQAYVPALLYPGTDTRSWTLGGLALALAVVFGMRFGDDDLWTPWDASLTRDDKCKLIWALFPSFVTSVVAVQRVVHVRIEDVVMERLAELAKESHATLEVLTQLGGSVGPSAGARGGRIAAAGGAAQLQQQQRQPPGWTIPNWAWIIGVSMLFSWLQGGSK